MFLCCKDFQESRGGDTESFPSSHRCAGKVGMSGHGARRDTVMSEGLDTARKAGRIPRELTFGRGCSGAREKHDVGWRKSPASGQDLLLALGYDLRQQGKVGRCGKVLAEAEQDSSGARTAPTRPWPHFCTPRKVGKEGGRCLIPEIWDLKPGRTKAQEV